MTTALLPVRPWRLWLVWGVGVAAYVLSVTNRTSLSAVGVDAAVRFDADASALSLFAVIQLAVYGAMQIPVGLLLDRFGARPIITAGMVLMALGQLVMAFAPDVGIGILARVLVGAGDAAVFPSVLRVIAVWFPDRQAPLLVQITGLVGQSGQLLAILPLAALLHATIWSVAFGSLAGLGVLFTVLTFAVIRNRPPDRDADVSVDTETGAIRAVTSAADLREGFRESWAHPATRLAFWSHFTTPFAGTAFVMLWGFPFLTVGEGLSPATASLVFTSFVIFGIAVGPGHRRALEPASDAPFAHARAADDRDPGRRVARRHRVARPGAAVAPVRARVRAEHRRSGVDDRVRPRPHVQPEPPAQHRDRAS